MISFVVVFAMFAAAAVGGDLAAAGEFKPVFEDPADFPLMGDWEGKWINPHAGHEKYNPQLAAQLICLTEKQYLVRILPKLNVRSVPYLEVEADVKENKIVINQSGWNCTFADGVCKGNGRLHGKQIGIELKKVERLSPTLGQKPPKGAKVLFDGSGFDAWQHLDGRKVTWSLKKFSVEWETACRKNYKAMITRARDYFTSAMNRCTTDSGKKLVPIVTESFGPCYFPDHKDVDWTWYKLYNSDAARIIATLPYAGTTLSNYAEPLFRLWDDVNWHRNSNLYIEAMAQDSLVKHSSDG